MEACTVVSTMVGKGFMQSSTYGNLTPGGEQTRKIFVHDVTKNGSASSAHSEAQLEGCIAMASVLLSGVTHKVYACVPLLLFL